MAGGTGNDTYVVDNASDIVTEAAAAGNDTVNAASATSWRLTSSTSRSPARRPSHGTGNILDNWLRGNTGINTLAGWTATTRCGATSATTR
jgi:Ca2+-binding RTX toxin-like protein